MSGSLKKFKINDRKTGLIKKTKLTFFTTQIEGQKYQNNHQKIEKKMKKDIVEDRWVDKPSTMPGVNELSRGKFNYNKFVFF